VDQHKVVEALHGVGSRQAGALHEYGIHTVGLPAVVSPDVFTSRSAPPPRPSSAVKFFCSASGCPWFHVVFRL
jgi:hypothetical protein